MKVTHYLPRVLSVLGGKGVAACGIYVSREKYGDKVTGIRQDVTCGNCKRTRVFNEPGNQERRIYFQTNSENYGFALDRAKRI